MTSELIIAITKHQKAFDVELIDDNLVRLDRFYEIVQEHNPLLHLVGSCSAEEFAIRHVLEPLTLLRHLPQKARFADVGTGAGLPGIPCLIVRPDLSAALIESKLRKAEYLRNAVGELDLSERADVIERQFDEVRDKDFSIVTSRALDKFTEKLPRLLKWAKGRRLLLFGGPTLGEALTTEDRKFEPFLMPMSERRFLYVVEG